MDLHTGATGLTTPFFPGNATGVPVDDPMFEAVGVLQMLAAKRSLDKLKRKAAERKRDDGAATTPSKTMTIMEQALTTKMRALAMSSVGRNVSAGPGIRDPNCMYIKQKHDCSEMSSAHTHHHISTLTSATSS